MGKKSKSKRSSGGAQKAADATLAKDFNNKLTITPSETASCWICLDDDPDDFGQPIRRDCSCRGDSGWVHLGCIIKYAESKSEEWIAKNGEMYWGTGMLASGGFDSELGDTAPWGLCPNCKQGYLNQFAIDVMDAKVAFTQKRFPTSQDFPCDPFKYIHVLLEKLVTLHHVCDGELAIVEVAAQGRKVAGEIFEVAAKMRNCLNHNSIPQSRERITQHEASTYQSLGDLSVSEISHEVISREDGSKEAVKIKNYEKSIALSKSIGDHFSASNTEICLGRARMILKPKNGKDEQKQKREAKENIHLLRERLKILDGIGGGPGAGSHSVKQDLAVALLAGGHVIEAERLCEELAITCRQVNGGDHSATKSVVGLLKVVKTRRVQFRNGDPANFKLLRYTDSGDKCVVRGPMTRENFGVGEGKTFTVDIGDVGILPPTPVVCVGLKGAKHLNGKIGDARDYDHEKGRYTVVFEDNKSKSALVKYENLRVLIDLPKRDE
eukprot:scaffold10339_cov94-Skeletonema_dohrnii-CCMP3373.AAC.3